MDDSILIAVLMGGPGSEREVSLNSGRAVLSALRGEGLRAVGVDAVNTEPVFPEGTDLVFNVIHGTFGEDGVLQEYLESIGIAYTGAGSESSRLAFDKIASKACFKKSGIPTPDYEVIDVRGGLEVPRMTYPYVVKPPREGSSVGVHIVRNPDERRRALEDAASFGSEVLVEQFVEGKELTVGIVGGETFPVVHIVPRSGFYDMSNKYPWMGSEGATDYFCPADLDAKTTRIVQEVAMEAHQALGIEVYSRVDVLLDSLSNPYILEANTIPGMTASSLLPKGAAAATPGYEFGALCRRIGELSLSLRA
ncbi:MAG TPA: D-alanine--D-alanine ligase [Verrucomicrobiales bacterium]|nr:D-alanine--D-alanine ligase [Verrucomicrobiales bacterium]HCQ38529.1 D-alanine--D-alanine ligase [Verrucomicrobiales bacterium]|tara:strand:- start:451 stop:1374 length:924 start_codon:yes stop_codon:yes gene_type:complete